MCFTNDYYADVYGTVERKARKEHKCDECQDPIERQERYLEWSSLSDGSWYNGRVCLRCRFDTKRIFDIEKAEGCRWSERFPNSEELYEALVDRGLDRTPKQEVPFGFPVMWEVEASIKEHQERKLALA